MSENLKGWALLAEKIAAARHRTTYKPKRRVRSEADRVAWQMLADRIAAIPEAQP